MEQGAGAGLRRHRGRTPSRSRNGIEILRLKDKLGNRSNASAELELVVAAMGSLLGEEGRGVRTIIEMVAGTRLDCVLGSAALMRAAVSEASSHAAHRTAFGARLADQPAMHNVLADLEAESEAAIVLGLRLAAAVDGADDPHEQALRRIGLPQAKFWVCKRTPLGGRRGDGGPRRQRLHQRLGAATAVPGVAAELHRGAQRHGQRTRRASCPASRTRGTAGVARRDRAGRGQHAGLDRAVDIVLTSIADLRMPRLVPDGWPT
jgi:hypothetical protein